MVPDEQFVVGWAFSLTLTEACGRLGLARPGDRFSPLARRGVGGALSTLARPHVGCGRRLE